MKIIEKKKENNTIELQEDVRLPETNQILEKGDRIKILKEMKVSTSWEDNEELAEEVIQALDDAGLIVRFDYSDYERSQTIKLNFDGESFELDLAKVSY